MRTPEEIKRGMEICSEMCNSASACKVCPYDDECRKLAEEEGVAPGSAMMRDAIEYIQRLEDHLREVTQKTPQWNSVYTQMPKDGQHVLTVNGDGVMEVLYYDKEWPNAFCGCGGLLKVCNITHWMPLPEAPNEEENEKI